MEEVEEEEAAFDSVVDLPLPARVAEVDPAVSEVRDCDTEAGPFASVVDADDPVSGTVPFVPGTMAGTEPELTLATLL